MSAFVESTERVSSILQHRNITGDSTDTIQINCGTGKMHRDDQFRFFCNCGFDRLRLYADGKVGIVDMPFDVMEAYGFTDDHLGTLVDIARGLQGVQVAAAIRQSGKEGVYRVSVRSSCHVDVAAVCAEFGGGGHIKAAGCTITCGGGIEAVVDMIAKALVAAF